MANLQKIKNGTKKVSRAILGQKTTSNLGKVYRKVFKKEIRYKRMVDVLFINGCDLSVPHPPRYRVTHQREQLEANNITTEEMFYTQVSKQDVKYANAFVIFRCPYLDSIGELIEEAHRLNKPVFYDIDDLVVDTKYTDMIPYVQGLNEEEKALYDDGVNRMGKTLKMCDAAITTTKALADELANYVPKVYVNRNNASEAMYKCSLDAIELKHRNYFEDIRIDEGKNVYIKKREKDEVRIGYFSGSITHNADVELIKDSLVRILKENSNVKLYLVGELDLPEDFKEYRSQIVIVPFIDWHNLPKLVASVDINLAPIEDTIFNRAKSENKWVEASLVKTVTVASNVGAFAEMIEDGKTGYLCEDNWYDVLSMLVKDTALRKEISENAFAFVKENCITLYNGKNIKDIVSQKFDKTLMCALPSSEISGGIMVALKHLCFLRKNGWNITIVASHPSLTNMVFDGFDFPVIYMEREAVDASFEKGIATMWSTVPYLESHSRIKNCYYLVQNYETDFYGPDHPLRLPANRTYSIKDNRFKYVTISKWCQKWLKKYYDQDALYAPNGIETKNFNWKERDFSDVENGKRKVRILIEGDSAVKYKGVDDSFNVVKELDPDKYEIWYMSYNAGPKDWYRVDKFLHRIPYTEVGKVYEQCDILLKSSTLESFSYPPLEMMATGGFVVAVKNGGNQEYLKDGENCLFYESGDSKAGAESIERIVNDNELRNTLNSNVKELVKSREWKMLEESILNLYDV